MERIVMGCLIVVIVGITPAHAGSYTVTTTPEQDQALARMQKRQAGMGKTSGQAVLTPQQFIQKTVDGWLHEDVAGVQRESACAKVTDAVSKKALGCPTL